MVSVLFVCLGNICRSPAAEAVFKKIVSEKNQENLFTIDSAATSANHIGEQADERMRMAANSRGIQITSRGRQFTENDFKDFDHIIVMDNSNYKNVLKLSNSPKDHVKVKTMMSFDPSSEYREVPDPYFGGQAGFDVVLDLLNKALRKFYDSLEATRPE